VAEKSAAARLVQFDQAIELRRQSPEPGFEGLSIEGRRKINLAVVAMCQELCAHFSVHDIAMRARAASCTPVAELNYGDASDCAWLTERIQEVFRGLESGRRLSARTQKRSLYLTRCAEYRSGNDTVPVAGAFARIPELVGETGMPGPGGQCVRVDVLADDFWDVGRLLLD